PSKALPSPMPAHTNTADGTAGIQPLHALQCRPCLLRRSPADLDSLGVSSEIDQAEAHTIQHTKRATIARTNNKSQSSFEQCERLVKAVGVSECEVRTC